MTATRFSVLSRPVDAEAVHAEQAAVGDELLEVAEVVGVPGVADHDPAEVDALLGEDLLLLEAAVGGGLGVGRDRRAGGPMRLGDRPQDPLDARVTPGRSVAHLSTAALMPVSAMPSVMSRTNMSTIGSLPPARCPASGG